MSLFVRRTLWKSLGQRACLRRTQARSSEMFLYCFSNMNLFMKSSILMNPCLSLRSSWWDHLILVWGEKCIWCCSIRPNSMESTCHARDNQSHPRPKDSPSCLVPPPSRLLQIAEITRTSPLRTSYVIQHRFVSPQPNLEHLKTSPKWIQPHATNLALSPARPGSRRSTRLLKNSLSSLRYI